MTEKWYEELDRLMEERDNLNAELSAVEESIMLLLWHNKDKITILKMTQLLNVTKQTIYNRWARYGFSDISEEQNRASSTTQY
jgi:hypothetical protein